MSKTFTSPKFVSLGFVGLLGIGAGVWGLVGLRHGDTKPALEIPKEFSVAALQRTPPEQGFEAFRKAMDREDLTEEQKRQIRENGREVMEKRMDERVNEYFACPSADERKRILDRQIDEFEKFRKEREAEREKMTDEEREKQREKWQKMREGRPEPTKAERKTFSESRSSDKQAQHMAYRQAMQDRMKERGIETPRWGPGGPGGPGPRGGG